MSFNSRSNFQLYTLRNMKWNLVINQFNRSDEEFYLLPWIKFFNVMNFQTEQGYESPLFGFEFGIFKFYYTFAIQKTYQDF
jgi:hypothetical protein